MSKPKYIVCVPTNYNFPAHHGNWKMDRDWQFCSSNNVLVIKIIGDNLTFKAMSSFHSLLLLGKHVLWERNDNINNIVALLFILDELEAELNIHSQFGPYLSHSVQHQFS